MQLGRAFTAGPFRSSVGVFPAGGPAATAGAVLAFAVAGAAPFGVGSAAALVYRVANEAPDLDRVPPELRPLIERCLAKEPGERPSPGDLLSELGGELIPENWLPETVADTIPRYEPSARIAALVAAGPPRTGAPAPGTPAPGIPVPETLSLEIRARGNAAQATWTAEMPAPELDPGADDLGRAHHAGSRADNPAVLPRFFAGDKLHWQGVGDKRDRQLLLEPPHRRRDIHVRVVQVGQQHS